VHSPRLHSPLCEYLAVRTRRLHRLHRMTVLQLQQRRLD
jgi:hypothetical protein